MEPEHKKNLGTAEPQGKKELKEAGEQYLFALIKCADWINKPYKELAEESRGNTEVLKLLYLCACDGLPAEEARAALGKKPPEGALKLLRQKYLKESVVSGSQDELTGLKGRTAALEKEVRQMNGLLRHVTEHTPDFEPVFPDFDPAFAEDVFPEYLPEEMGDGRILESPEPPSGMEQGESVSGEPTAEASPGKSHWGMDIPETGAGNIKTRWLSWKRKRESAAFMERALEAGYSKEQLNYLLDCLEAGMTVKQIEKFASPKLPVEIMGRLRRMEEIRKKESEGWNRTGK